MSVEVMPVACGALALEVVTKHARGHGFGFEGRLFIDDGPERYAVQVVTDEETTGAREAMVNALRMQMGELDLSTLMSAPVDPATGGRPIPGMKLDPYDSSFDDQATYSASDDPRIDVIMPAHPLALVRATLERVRSTWECSSSEVQNHVPRRGPPTSTGPRTVLSDKAVRELHRLVSPHSS